LKSIEIKMLNMPERDFTEIRFETKIGRMMAFTMTKIRNHVITKINERAKKLHEFKLKGLDAMLSIDIVQSFMKEEHWLECSYSDFKEIIEVSANVRGTQAKIRMIQSSLTTNKSFSSLWKVSRK